MSKPPPLSRPDIKLRLKLGIGEDSIGPGKAELLKQVAAHGSISAAAREMGINYRRAWFLLETISTALDQPVVITSKGGKDGGGAKLTDAGTAILKAYDNIKKKADQQTRKQLDVLYQSLLDSK